MTAGLYCCAQASGLLDGTLEFIFYSLLCFDIKEPQQRPVHVVLVREESNSSFVAVQTKSS